MTNSRKSFKYFDNIDMDRIDNNYMEPVFDTIISKYEFNNVLDYGCGNGLFGSYFKKRHKSNWC